MNDQFYAVLARMKYISRWALMRNTRAESVHEHSFDVALLAHALAELHNRRFGGQVNVEQCVLQAMYHDAPEIFTGDMPTPVKYDNEDIRRAYRQVEQLSAEKLLGMLPDDLQEVYRPLLLPDETSEEARIVKAADKISALLKCVEELGQGNREFASARRTLEAAIRGMKLPAADCFLEEFLPAFELTLDEQG
ncbi:MAG: 5'-deoxynucleotidase [Ruminococcaceae bacterium]|nr:5'-deoxynucleotidase [Oscillospiraceae bacterium]